MRQHYGQDYIKDELRRIGDQLDEEITCYLIGGGAMALDGLKDATKDIDLVLVTDHAFTTVLVTVQDMGYEEVKELDDPYVELGAQTILENNDGCRLDIFHTQIVDTLHFSDGMQNRATQVGQFGGLIVKEASQEDIFLFKAVATRPADIEDMQTLLQTGLDFKAIIDEIEAQRDLIGSDLFITDINEALYKLQEDYGATPSLLDDVEDLASKAMDKLAILHALDEPATTDELAATVDLGRELETLLDELDDEQRITREGDTVQRAT